MKTNNKLNGYILRSSTTGLLFSCLIVALCSAIHAPEQSPKALPQQENAAFGANGDQHRTLNLEERVAYQRAIEEVYWQHRIWPKANPDPKPPLDKEMSRVEIEKKVEDYLRNSQALEDYWQRPISSDELQAEMDRIASHTKQPSVLRELFASLGNDPFVIAECLARPLLAERLITESYGHDQRFHGKLKPRAEPELRTHPSASQMKWSSGMYTETEDRLKLSTIAWLKEPLRSWLAKAKTQVPVAMAAKSANYELPAIASPSVACTDDTWTPTSLTNVPAARLDHTAVWTGTEMIVWGGSGVFLPAGGRYTPSTDSWQSTSLTNAPANREAHTAVWIGTEMIVWGGYSNSNNSYLNTGGRYNPGTDSWTATTTTGAPAARQNHTAVWTGTRMIVWGGATNVSTNTGGRYNPILDSWQPTSLTNAPSERAGHTAVAADGQMIVWGGNSRELDIGTGGRYNPTSDSWTATSISGAPTARGEHTAVWTGTTMIVWGGRNGVINLNDGGRYNPSTDSWTATSAAGAPSRRDHHTAVWTGSQMIVWGGHVTGSPYVLNTGARYNPSTNSWTATSTTNVPSARWRHTAVWTGSQMIVWAGVGESYRNITNSGGRYCVTP